MDTIILTDQVSTRDWLEASRGLNVQTFLGAHGDDVESCSDGLSFGSLASDEEVDRLYSDHVERLDDVYRRLT